MDWNGDGRSDIITGDRLGNVYFFRRLSYGDIFLTYEDLVRVGGKPIHVGFNSAPSVVYWNGDTLPDLVVGRMEGIPTSLYLYINEGTAGEPLFNYTDTVFCAGEPVQIYVSYPDSYDLTGDGLQDMTVGSSSGKIACFINSGTPGQPLFQEFQNLRADGGEITYYSYIRPSVCDWNSDGTPDVLAADFTGTVDLYLGIPGAGIEEQEDETGKLHLRILNNPASDALRYSLKLEDTSPAVAFLYSFSGRLVAEYDLGTIEGGFHEFTCALNGLGSGCYVLTVETDGSIITETFVITR
ncbi:MAG: hypothetical protein GF388_05875 [Candidatus Aegiribacteria sp.]|nr:hypothetical protein [Candidatus Aegiribacteria sp.]MBD3294709.1 hypothetical protein [Candidatus Fermentibacteria bacterium]